MSSQRNIDFFDDVSSQQPGLTQVGAATQSQLPGDYAFDYGDDDLIEPPRNDFSQLDHSSQSKASSVRNTPFYYLLNYSEIMECRYTVLSALL